MIKKIHKDTLLVFTSAGMYSISQSIESLWFVCMVAIVPLMYALTPYKNPKRALCLGIMWGVAITTGIAYWIIHALLFHYDKSPVFALAFFLLFAAIPVGILYGLFFVLFTLFQRRTGIFLHCVFPSLWVVSEYIRELVPVFIPWGLAGYAAAGNIYIAQTASLTGVYGLSFIVALLNGMFFRASSEMAQRFASMRWKTSGFRSILIGGPLLSLSAIFIAIFLLVAYGNFSLQEWRTVSGNVSSDKRDFRATIIQGSHDVKERWNDRSFELRLAEYLYLTEKAMRGCQSDNVVIWPETILNSPAAFSGRSLGLIFSSIPDSSVLLAGGVREDSLSNVYNSILQMQGGKITGWYDKRTLLPFAEYTPFGATILGKFYDSPDSFRAGEEPSILEMSGIPVGASICFESTYPSHIAASVRNGAQILVNVSNDTWFGRTSQPQQHHRIARVRAIEAGRYMLRSSNSGISSIIAPTGEVIAEIGLGEVGSIQATIRPLVEMTPYHSHGNLIILISLAVSIFSMAARALTGSYYHE